MVTIEPRKQPGQRRSKAMVETILDATARILERDGYAGVTTNHVAELAGVSVGSLYQYFPNKNALVGAVAVQHAEAMNAMLAGGIGATSHDDLPTMVGKLIRATLEAHALRADLRRVLIEELPRIGRPARALQLKNILIENVAALLSARRSEIGVTDTALAAFMIVNTVEHLTYQAHASGLTVSRQQLEDELHRWIVSYLTSGRPRTNEA